MDNIIKAHKSMFQEMESKTGKGIEEIKEFIILLEERMDSELVNAKAYKQFSTFELRALNHNKIFEEMLNVAESKSVQSYDLIKNIKSDIYQPLCQMLGHQSKALEMMSIDGRRAMKNTCELEDELYRIKTEYFKSKSEMAKAVDLYEEFKEKANFDEESMAYYKSKLFSQMNIKMRISQEKGSIYQMWVAKCNENLKYYSKQMKNLIKIFSDMAKDRNQMILDSLNKLVLFETSMDMNLKYDTKMFTKMIEDMQSSSNKDKPTDDSVGENPTKDSISTTAEKAESNENSTPENHPSESSTIEESKDSVLTENSNSPIKANWENILDKDYIEYISKFDQIGEYRYQEEPDTDTQNDENTSQPLEISDQIKFKYEEEIFDIVDKVWNSKIDLLTRENSQIEDSKGTTEDYRDKFETLLEEKVGRTVFTQCFNNYKVKRDTVIPSRQVFENLSVMMIECVEKIGKFNDMETAIKIIEICNSFYIEVKEKGKPPRMYLTKCIQEHSLFKDINFWEKIVFESIKIELRSEFFVYDYDSNTQNTYRKIIMSTLSLIILDMLSFKIDKNEVRELVLKFCESHGLTEDQIITLITKIANYGEDFGIAMPSNIKKAH